MSAADSSGMTVVLGWDGLDFDLVTEWDLADAFGPHHREIETFDNPVHGKPHTAELWPSIITGLSPEEHGIYAATADEGADWANRYITLAATLSKGVVPEGVRARIGRYLRSHGAELDVKDAAYYADHEIATAFDDRRALPLAIPNYRTPIDEELDLVFDRGAQLGQYLRIERAPDGTTRHLPRIPIHRLEQRLVAEAQKKIGVVRAAIQREYDIVFVWLGYLDTVGHLDPVVAESGWQRRAYALAAEWTEGLRQALTTDDTLVCVSDHGLQAGEHTHAAFFGVDDADLAAQVESVLDVAAALDRVTPTSASEDDPAIRPPYRMGDQSDGDVEGTADDVRDRLSDLGYLE